MCHWLKDSVQVPSRMKDLVALLLLGSLDLVRCCTPQPGSLNIARSGEAAQSSTLVYSGVTTVASNAIDGGKDQNFYHGSCSHTIADWEPWWRLDLKQKQSVYVIVVYGRSDYGLWRLQDLEVRIGDSPDNYNPLCGTITNSNNPTTTFCCNGLAGRYISAVIPGRSEQLTLCEVEVYNGTMTENDVCW
ncbi:PREDICTED: fucolectin-like [Nanorana parkeri]|uniref:fucolectin-like n=1 Tax=Nanorana parkeri TaxID=125878 RepID=UPI0008545BE2|nr:PREDICTED: fucolectin-like [Nanorana parkeri]